MSYLKITNNAKRYVFLMSMLAGLVACGGGEEVEGGLPGTGGSGTGTGGDIGDTLSNPPHTIALTYPLTEAIVNLGNGVYRRRGTAIVTDSEGNLVADGTRINFFVIDSVMARGTITPGTDSLSGSTLTDVNATLADGTTLTNLDAAFVDRNSAQRFITEGDHLLLEQAEGVDKVRLVTAGSVTNSTLGVSTSYFNTYPNTVYDGSTPSKTTEYVVGASLLGASIQGTTGTLGYATTTDGYAEFFVTYPANVNTILTGCYGNPLTDTRQSPSGSADVYLVASVQGDISVSAVDGDQFCFSPIRGGLVEVAPNVLSGAGSTLVFGTVTDGGDGVPLPFTSVAWGVQSDGAVVGVSPSPITTDENGNFAVFIDVGTTPGDATVVFTANGGATGSVSVSVPAP